VNWRKSALIVDNVAMTYAGEKIDFTGDWDGTTLNDSYSWGGFDGSVSLPKDVSFVPPQSMISEIPLALNPTFDHIDKKSYRDSRIGDKKETAVMAERIDFEETNSPLAFKSYLTVYFQPERPMTFEQDFYLSTLIKTNRTNPSSLPSQMLERGDFFYVEKPANNTALYTTLGIVAGTGLIVLGIVYGDGENLDYDYDDDYW